MKGKKMATKLDDKGRKMLQLAVLYIEEQKELIAVLYIEEQKELTAVEVMLKKRIV